MRAASAQAMSNAPRLAPATASALGRARRAPAPSLVPARVAAAGAPTVPARVVAVDASAAPAAERPASR
jgi:hypothetical protein